MADRQRRGENVSPRVSIIIPIYNEEAILHSAVVDLLDRLSEFDWPYELVLAENGSRDETVAVAEGLAERFPRYGRSAWASRTTARRSSGGSWKRAASS